MWFNGAVEQIRTADLVITNYTRVVLTCCLVIFSKLCKAFLQAASQEKLLYFISTYRLLLYTILWHLCGFCVGFS